jgi:Ca2+-binding RTX toxin-like protein
MPQRSRLLALAAAVVATLLVPAVAPAASVSLDGGTFRFEAPPGEANDVVTYAHASGVTVDDRTHPLSAGPGCRPSELSWQQGWVECPLNGRRLERVVMLLGDGNDVLFAGGLFNNAPPHPESTLDGGEGNDRLFVSVAGSDLERSGVVTRGGPGSDELSGGGVVQGGPGNDRVRGVGGSNYSRDRLEGGEGNDVLDGGLGPDVVSGGQGEDALIETVDPSYFNLLHDERLDGGEDDDRISAGGRRSSLFGGPGDDDIVSGARLADGGEGNDTMRGGSILRGGPGDDSLTGGSGDDAIGICCQSFDLLEGGPGVDVVAAGGRDAVIDGGADSDTLVPGTGLDTLSYRSRQSGVRVDLRQPGSIGAIGGEGDSVGPGFERFEGSAGDDEIIAGGAPLSASGWLGRDRLIGGSKDDTLDGGGDDDLIVGGAGNDVLDGGGDSHRPPGADTNIKAPGNDTIDGGPGNDTIRPRGGEDYVTAGAGDDRVDARERADADLAKTPLNYSHIIQMAGADQVWCGTGHDRADGDYADDLALDCELTSEGTPRWRELKARPGRKLRLTVRCAWAEARPCKGTALLRTAAGGGGDKPVRDHPAHRAAPERCRGKAGAMLARSRFRIRAGRVNYVYLDLSAAAERRLRRRGCIAVHAVLRFTDATGRDWLATRSLTLKRAGFAVGRQRSAPADVAEVDLP